MALRIVFCGTPAFAVPALRHLIEQPDFEVVGVVTQPDRPRGRGQATGASPVKDAATEASIPVFQPGKIKSDEGFEYFKRLQPDAVVIIAYGQIISQRLIDIPRLGWTNVHASLLPKYRGAAPINWAIVNGEKRTGLTTMQIDAGLDTGPMLLKYETEIAPDETAPELTSRLAQAGAPLITETLRGLPNGAIAATPQDHSQATFAPPLKKEDGRVDWSLEAHTIHNRIRGMQPWPGAFTLFRGKNCQVWGAAVDVAQPSREIATGALTVTGNDLLVACGHGTTLRLDFLQLEGRKRITAREFANGAHLASGESFGG